MNKKIAFISDHASPLATLGGVDSGGQNVYVAEVARCLAQKGYLVDIFTRRENTVIPKVVDFAPHVRVIHVPAGPATILPKEELFDYMQEFTEYVLHFIQEEKIEYDLIHAHFWLSGMVAMEIKKELDIPFVITFHALGQVRRLHQGTEDKFPPQREQIERDIMWHADKIIAECPNDLKDLMQLYHAPQEKLEIIPCGYSPEDFYPIAKEIAKDKLALSSELDYILQLGRIVPRKGIDNVIEAFACIHTSMPRLRLLIVGGNLDDPAQDPELVHLQQVAEDLQVDQKVIFVGQKTREELKYYYSAADIFVTTPWYEPFGITPLESMACGTPVVGSDVGGITYTVNHGETGLLVPPRNFQKLAEALSILYLDTAKREKMGQCALDHVRKTFTWQTVSKQIHELYEQLFPLHRQKKTLQQLRNSFQEASQTFIKSADTLPKQIIKVAQEMCKTLLAGHKIMICGNGGSAAESQHFVAELVGRFEIPKRPGYPVLSLNTDNAVLTAWANDFGYEYIFQRQVQALGQTGDMLICLSTSGNSANILKALQQANKQNITAVNILGKSGGKAAQFADYNIIVPSQDTARIQEVHLHIIHQLCWLVEARMEETHDTIATQNVNKLIA